MGGVGGSASRNGNGCCAHADRGFRKIPHSDLDARLGRSRAFIAPVVSRAQVNPKRIVFPEGENPKILRAAYNIVDENIAKPILLGRRYEILRCRRRKQYRHPGH